MPLAAPNNCWPANLQKFTDALSNSAQFQTLVEAADAAAALARIFGKRLTWSADGHAWTPDELATLRYYAMVYGDPGTPYGKHLQNNACYLPHGVTVVALGRLVLEKDLVDHGKGRTGLSDTHDRDWQNIVGTVIDQMLAWLPENAGPYPITTVDVTDDSETRAQNQPRQGMWQFTELTFIHGRTG